MRHIKVSVLCYHTGKIVSYGTVIPVDSSHALQNDNGVSEITIYEVKT